MATKAKVSLQLTQKEKERREKRRIRDLKNLYVLILNKGWEVTDLIDNNEEGWIIVRLKNLEGMRDWHNAPLYFQTKTIILRPRII